MMLAQSTLGSLRFIHFVDGQSNTEVGSWRAEDHLRKLQVPDRIVLAQPDTRLDRINMVVEPTNDLI